MKFRSLFLFTAIVLLGTSCDKISENDPQSTIVNGESASLSLQISGDTQTKAYGNPSQEDKILRLDAFVFNVDGTLEALKTVSSQNNSITKVDNIAITSGEKRIFVLANYAGDVSSVKNLTELQKVMADLSSEKDNGQLTLSTELVDVIILPGKNYLGYSANPSAGTLLEPHTLLLTRLVARVKIEDMQWSSSEYSFEEPTAFILNAVSAAGVIYNPTPSFAYNYYQGLAGSGDLYPSSSTVISEGNNFLSSAASNNSTYFYVYENQLVNNSIYPTMIVLRTKVKQGNGYIANVPGRVDANGYTYFPVIINKEGNNSTITGAKDGHKYIKRNNTYSIKTTVKGLGTSNPFSSEAPSSLNVQVSVASWDLNVTHTEVFE